ncbi:MULTISPECIES: DUF1778 domain-containing protein [unclassified Spirulina]|uniref:type II toxin -antitoxin system TacA 1-like antitoxin n=1 Tax=unclassified Spirulina TaxID=2684457 RepID=UPI001951647B|nr:MULTISPECIES: DUF1778 domain-containing protein [Spirulina]MEA5468108.1 DUF1778 domain-containing protein [Spirulina sp. 06S082]
MSLSTEIQETITLQLNREHKKILDRAAAKHCMTLTEYLLKLVLDAARDAIPDPEPDALVLSDRGREKLQLNLQAPPQGDRPLSSGTAPREKDENWLL